MSQKQIALFENLGLPQGAVAVNRRAWFQDVNGNRAVFVDQTAFHCYSLRDPTLHRFCAVQLVEAGIAKVSEVCAAFELSSRTFSRWRSSLRKEGIAGLVAEQVGRKPKSNPTLAAGIVHCYHEGMSTYKIGARLGVCPSTVQRILRSEGVQLRDPFDHHRMLPLAVDDAEALQTQTVQPQTIQPQNVEPQNVEPQNVEPQNVEPETVELQIIEPQVVEATSIPYASPLDRIATIKGLIKEGPVVYQSADNVSCAGVLLGLALLEGTHLMEESRAIYGCLKNGWYGLRSLIWTLVAMALLRIKRPEQIKHHDPAELGRVLGMPRAAEVKTVRGKLYDISLMGKAAQWHRALAKRRAAEQPLFMATLYVDGHLRAYYGWHRIGKTRVSRLKRVLRAETDYWVHHAQGQPLLVVHESVDSSFHQALVNSVLPEIREVIGQRRVRIVFDREGWSRELFHDLLRLNFDFITYRKGDYEPLAESEFQEVTCSVAGQPPVSYELAESAFEQEGWPRLRLLAVKKKNGSQTHILATCQATWEALSLAAGEPDPPAAQLAWEMFGRWSQENWFKYMRPEYALDVLVDYSVELDDQEHLVTNPQWRERDRQVASVRASLERARAKYAKLILPPKLPAGEFPTSADDLRVSRSVPVEEAPGSAGDSVVKCKPQDCSCLVCRRRVQAEEVSRLSAELERLRAERKKTPRKIPLREASDRDPVKLSYERKLFTDTIKLAAYEIETRLYEMLGPTFSNCASEGRGIIKSLLSATGDLRVQGDVVEVHLEQLSAPRYTQAMQSLCQQLTALSPRLPETDYRLRFFVKPRPIGE